MRIIRSDRFLDELHKICAFIALDSAYQAKKFKRDLFAEFKNITNNPYGFRHSFYDDDPAVHDYVTKKRYTVPYRIDEKNKKIILLGIFKSNLWRA